jgi:hypothetical protein
MAAVKACASPQSPLNSGSDCNITQRFISMVLAVPKTGFSFTLANLTSGLTWFTPLLHAAIGSRVYPLFGYNARISDIKNDAGTSIVEKLANGVDVFVKYGVLGMTFETTEGGECYTKILESFVGKHAQFSFIFIDEQGVVKCKDNGNGTFSGIDASSIIGENPTLADFKGVYKSMITLKFTNDEWVKNSVLLSGGNVLLQQIGLINADLLVGTAGASSTTKLKFQVLSDCGSSDLTALFPSTIALPANYVVTKASDGSSVVISAGAVSGTHVELTGTFTSSASYVITPVPPATLLTNGITGYEFINALTIAIP